MPSDLLHDRMKPRREQHRLRSHRPHQCNDIGGSEPIVERNTDKTELGERVIDFGHFGPVVAKECDWIGLLQPQGSETMGQPVATLVGLTERESPARGGAIERFSVSKPARGSRERGAHDRFP
jgi:hypothetical protein